MKRALFSLLLLGACTGDTSKDFANTTDDSAGDSNVTTDDSPVDSQVELDGAALFAENCARCHGDDARGSRSGPDLSREMRLSDAQILRVIQNGEGDMPAIEVTEEEAQAIIDWLRETLQ